MPVEKVMLFSREGSVNVSNAVVCNADVHHSEVLSIEIQFGSFSGAPTNGIYTDACGAISASERASLMSFVVAICYRNTIRTGSNSLCSGVIRFHSLAVEAWELLDMLKPK